MRKLAIGCGIPLIFLLGLVLFGLQHYGPKFNIYLLPPSSPRYGQLILDKVELTGLYAREPKWVKARQEAQAELKQAKSYAQARQIVQKAVKIGGGKHSALLSPGQLKQQEGRQKMPAMKKMDGGLLYLKLPGILSSDPQIKSSSNYARRLNRYLTRENYRGIILDLSDNTGGNMYPMLIGLSSLLPDGDLLSFEDKYGNQTPVTLSGASLNGQSYSQLSSAPKRRCPLAIITNQRTASSAEMVVLAFSGLNQVRRFGQPSAGYTSANQVYPLYDGASLRLTTARVKTRDGKVYENTAIEPDVTSHQALKDAQAWLQEASHNSN